MLEQKIKTFAALADETRLRIINLLIDGELSVQDIVHSLDQSQPRVSRHLRILDEAGLITRIKEGGWVFCKLNNDKSNKYLLDYLFKDKTYKNPKERDIRRLYDLQKSRLNDANDFFFKQYKEQYYVDPLNQFSNVALDNQLREIIIKNIHTPMNNLFDMGTGSGKMLSLFSSLSKTCVGIDNNHTVIKMAKSKLTQDNRNNCKIIFGDITQTEALESYGKADLVIYHQVLHYFDKPQDLIREAKKLLKKGGFILIVDFLKHQNEFLRTNFSHRRLGFDETQIKDYFQKLDIGLVDKTKAVSFKQPNINELKVMAWLGKNHE